ncbi:MFS transporter [Wenxinia marina]|uniref:Permease of the major facilitator superfamily n=1 Tax=Wenxinia marina DSM 24838 TaxID=1123501 RepID=A0A0D0NRT1_9RHOB|nr:MFS transporter [Wenxinia marina]KIQ70950.1 Permease of the major facilitator superfamily [Wenxinia marina DSM 24838]GGL56052.1 MFS transporter [Wenxinia marina]
MIDRRRRIWGWMFFDWAQQPYATLGLTFVFGPYFASVAAQYFLAGGASDGAARAEAQGLWSLAQTCSGIVIALAGPILGAWADSSGRKMPWFYLFTAITVVCAASLWWLYPDGTNLYLVLVLFWIGFTASESAFNLANAILPSLGDPKDVGRISGGATAFGYWGGVLSLAIMLGLFVEQGTSGTTLLGNPPALGLDGEAMEGTRLVGPFIAVWFALFIIPFLRVDFDAPRRASRARPPLRQVLGELGQTIREVARRRSLSAFLVGSMLYRDALSALYSFGGIYATLVLDWSVVDVGVFGVIAAVSAAVMAWLGGMADKRFGPKPVLVVCCWVLIAVCVVIVSMSREHLFWIALPISSTVPDVIFYVCGAIIGGAGGVLYSASRSLMVRHTDPARPAEAFGLFALTGRVTAFLAPALITVFTYATGSNQLGFLPVIALFLIGLGLLGWVNKDGDRAEWSASSPPPSSP